MNLLSSSIYKRLKTYLIKHKQSLILGECGSQLISVLYFVVVQLAIEIHSLPVSTANGIKFSFIKMSDRDLKYVYLFCQTDTFLFVNVNILSF
jgi:hypothetical protein